MKTLVQEESSTDGETGVIAAPDLRHVPPLMRPHSNVAQLKLELSRSRGAAAIPPEQTSPQDKMILEPPLCDSAVRLTAEDDAHQHPHHYEFSGRRAGFVRDGSPFPSPTLQKRVTALAHLRKGTKELYVKDGDDTMFDADGVERGSSCGSLLPFDTSFATGTAYHRFSSNPSPEAPHTMGVVSNPVPIPGRTANRRQSMDKLPSFLGRRSPLHQTTVWMSREADNDDAPDAGVNIMMVDEDDDDPPAGGRSSSFAFPHPPAAIPSSRLPSPNTAMFGSHQYHQHHLAPSFPPRYHPPHPQPPPSPSALSDQPFGSLVGSYEESILSGRMSTLPSRPITFLAEIGVMGLGKGVKAKLKCPPHVNLSFPAYFYDLLDDETPSTPYVGVIDVENLKGLMMKKEGVSTPTGSPCEEGDKDMLEFRRKWRGGYRLPHKGQLQVIIKNPARTAVKLFLIPYDFTDMPPSTKTFLRQKLYALGSSSSSRRSSTSLTHRLSIPSLRDSAAHAPTTPGATARSFGSVRSGPPPPSDRNRLRDAIHLQFWCDAKRRLFLTGTVRVVFSHRAPDSDEKLTTVCEGPENPRFVPCDALPQVRRRRSRGGSLGAAAATGIENRAAWAVDDALGFGAGKHPQVPPSVADDGGNPFVVPLAKQMIIPGSAGAGDAVRGCAGGVPHAADARPLSLLRKLSAMQTPAFAGPEDAKAEAMRGVTTAAGVAMVDGVGLPPRAPPFALPFPPAQPGDNDCGENPDKGIKTGR
ncbi:hypothetical protein HDU96_000823 [Phlyctochytrium bullatum]|nr:hypothetical protein HDU96_000823 [Phlyctochytrium bullatum]